MQNEKKTSRQAIRTRKLLQNALVSLIQEQSFSSLRVQDITDRADLGRATFYLHYSDKEDLLTAIVDQSYQDMTESLQREGLEEGLIGMKWALEYARENPDLFQVVMGHQRTVKRIRALMVGRITTILSETDESEVVVDAMAHILAGALLGVFDWWLTQQDTLSPEELLALFSRLVSAEKNNLRTH